ncbi:hypothetical protein O181_087922 [Austropuccinia psidii MF-1]|uniref:Uncharacterized protein n=1 Tax=Austropuccinia psidii MF-1 TaxID=1389203 RepID=A0A9Q3IQM4_9BASI|nr:hypothetical protein [Austropuccinia psidii MF-1]
MIDARFALVNIWLGVEVGESSPEGSQVVIGVPGKCLGKRPNVNATKKNNKRHHTFEATKDCWDQGDEIINVEVYHNHNEFLHTETPPVLNETIHAESPPTSPKYSSISIKGGNQR